MGADDILKELEALGDERTKCMLMKNHSVKEPCFGVKIGDMKPIQKRVKADYQLALDLYDSGNYDAMYLASLIADDDKMTKRDLGRWVKGAYGGSLPGAVASVAAGGRYGWEMGMKWIDVKDPNVAATGWATLTSFISITDDADLDLPAIKKLVNRVKREIHKADDAGTYAMNNFVIGVGSFIEALSSFALEAAEKIGPVMADLGNNSCQIPFAPDYIRKVEKRGAIGKKRKSAKC